MPEITDKKSFRLFQNVIWSMVAISLILFILTLDFSYKYLLSFQNIFLLLFTGIVSSGLVSFVICFLRFNFLTKLVFLFHVLVAVTIGLLHHPGLIDDDTFILMDVLNKDTLTTWSSVGYSLFVSLFYKYDKSFFSQLVLQLFIYLVCVFSALRVFGTNSILRAVLLSACSMFPLVHAVNLYVVRDNIMALITTYAVLLCINQRFSEKQSDFFFLLKVGLLVFIASVFKQDGLMLIAAFPILLMTLNVFTKRQKWAATAFVWMMAAIWHVSLYKKNFSEISQAYQFAGVIHSLNYLVKEQSANISEVDKEVIQKVVDYDFISKNYNPYSIDAFHQRKHYLPVSDEDWRNFLITYRKLLLQFPSVFLKERLEVLSLAMNIGAPPFIYPDYFDSSAELALKIKEQHGMKRWNLFPALKSLHKRYLAHFCHANKAEFNNLFKLLGTPVFIFLLALGNILRPLNFNFFKIFALVSVFSFSRLVSVFLLAPEPQMKYYSFLIYTSFFLFIVTASYSRNLNSKINF